MVLSFFRTTVLYLLLLAVIRIMGKRQVGQMEPSEFVVTMLVANLASIPMENIDTPLYSGVIPILTVLAAELIFSLLCLRSMFFRRLLCGKPVILIENGYIMQENLRRTRITLDELTGHLREKDVLDITQVQYAILETNGNLSVFPYPKHMPASAMDAGIQARNQQLPVTVIGDGYLYRDNLAAAGTDEKWVEQYLRRQHTALKDVWLLTVDGAGKTVFFPKDSSH